MLLINRNKWYTDYGKRVHSTYLQANMKHVLITGGCGFIGSNLAASLVKEGTKVTCFDNLSRRGSELLLNHVLSYGCNFIHGDARNLSDFSKLKDDYDILIECSAEPSVLVGSQGSDASYLIENNLGSSIQCFEFARKRKIPILFLSTSRVYPYTAINSLKFKEQPTRFEYTGNHSAVTPKGISVSFPLDGRRSLYGATKLASELILQEYSTNYKLPSIINRCGVIAGPWQLGKIDQGIFGYWLCSHYFKKNLKYIGFGGQGKQVRDLLSIGDLCNLISLQIRNINRYYGDIFNIGGSTVANLSLQETTQLCQEITGNRVKIKSESKSRPADIIWYITDNGNTEKEFNWKPLDGPRTILSNIFEWIHSNEKCFRSLF